MNTLNLEFSFRPVKFGWVIKKDDFDALRETMMLSQSLWGGKYNPIIVADVKGSEFIVDSFNVDALFQIGDDPILQEFKDKYKYLIWPNVHKTFYLTDSPKVYSNFIDLLHPINLVYKEHVKNIHQPKYKIDIIEWDKNDPLSDVFLATFGYTEVNKFISKDYIKAIKSILPNETFKISQSTSLSEELFGLNSINQLSSYGLISRWGNNKKGSFYYGDSKSFMDIVNFWNLRARNTNIMFYDKNYNSRFEVAKNKYFEMWTENVENEKFDFFKRVDIWTVPKTETVNDEINKIFDGKISINPIWEYTWKSTGSIPLNTIPKSILGTINDIQDEKTLTFQLPDDIFENEEFVATEYFVVTLRILADNDTKQLNETTFFIPNLPDLNEFLARRFYYDYSRLRMSNEGISLIINASTRTLTLNALKKNELFSKIFDLYGYISEIPVPSLKAKRIIKQMNGIQGCRVFKIRGVRELLFNIKPSDTFQATQAISIIGDMDSSNKIHFEDFEDLYIERREKRKLTPPDVLKFLTEKAVFRVGLKLECPNCQLEPWIHLDQLKTISICEFCGYEFNISRQLRDRNWFYRPSSLFSSKDAQSGSIPVILTLQQLDTIEIFTPKIFSTGIVLKSKTDNKFECELDLVYLSQRSYSKLQLAIGECKTNGNITEIDVTNLTRVADSLPINRFDTYIIFSKLTSFTPEEIELCKKAQLEFRYRVIMLTDRELEPYHVYEKTKKEFNIQYSAISLEDLAKITNEIYFNPQKSSDTTS